MPLDLPPLSDIATAFVFVGALFVLRFLLALRRLRSETGARAGFALSDFARTRRANAFGAEHEPERRHAVRQLYTGLAFLALGVGLFGWLLAASLLGFAVPAARLA
ncbi:hypothetical protein ACP4J4_12675 [Aureimonas ureilytica]|uniref:hypothetical protein n=1 Tax=Aureimonas ureilytica TaxID=401562 RepID=UPI003CF20A5D